MAFIVEDGSIVTGATSYVSLVEWVAYWADRGITVTQTATDQAALIIATQYVDTNNSWRGAIVSSAQALGWPRSGVIDNEGRVIASDVIPDALKYAVCEYAYRQLTAPLQPDVSVLGTVKSQQDKVDVLETKTEYMDGTGGYVGVMSYPLADNYLKGLTDGGVLGNLGAVGSCY